MLGIETSMSRLPASLISAYSEAKSALVSATGSSENLLHVHAGLAVYVLAVLVLRWGLRSPLPLAMVAALSVGNELLDWLSARPQSPIEPLTDIVFTLFWPGVIFSLARAKEPESLTLDEVGITEKEQAASG